MEGVGSVLPCIRGWVSGGCESREKTRNQVFDTSKVVKDTEKVSN